MIQFATPWILWGALSAALPILIHLFGKRKTRQVAFSSLRFLKTLQHEQIRTLRIKQILILILRTLLLLFLAFAFAGPRYAPSTASGVSHETSVFILDNTISSSREIRGDVYLNQLKSLARDIASQRNDAGAVIWTALMNPDERFVTPGGAVPEEFLNDLTPEYGQVEMTKYFDNLREWGAAQNFGNMDIFIFTDAQYSQFTPLQDIDLSPWKESRWFIVHPESDVAQAGMSDVDFSTALLQPGIIHPMEVRVTRSDSLSPVTTAISVTRDGEKIGQALLDWGDATEKAEQFEIPLEQSGFFRVEARLGEDAYLPDNSWYINGYIPQHVDVLLVSDAPETGLFLETALRSLADETNQITFSTTSSGNIAEAVSPSVDLVIVTNTRLTKSLTDALENALGNGTGLMLFPGDQIRQDNQQTVPGTDVKFGLVSDMAEGTYQQVNQVQWTHPVFRNLSYKERSTIQLPRLTRYFTLASGNYSSLLVTESGAPLLVESQVEQSNVWIWTVPPSLEWTDLPRRGIFIPMIVRSLYYLSGDGRRYENQLTTGDPVTYEVSSPEVSNQLTLITPEGQSVVVPVRAGRLVYDENNMPGQYSLYDQEKLLAVFSVNIPAGERDMQNMRSHDWQVIFGEQFGKVLRPGDGKLDLHNAGIVRGKPLWQWLFALALLCIIAEMLLTRTGRQTEEKK